MRRFVIGLFSAVVVLILFLVLFTYVRRPYERVLLDRFGNLIDEAHQARIWHNLYFCYPTDKLVRIDQRLHLKTLPLVEINFGKEPVAVKAFVVWRIVDPVAFRKAAGGQDEEVERTIETTVRALMGQELPNHTLDEFFTADKEAEQKVHALEMRIAKSATANSADGKESSLKQMGVEIADMGFSRLAFPPANAEAVYQRMVAELTKQATKYQSDGLAEADRIVSEGSKNAAEIRSKAQAKALEIRGQADAEALQALAAVTPTEEAREFYQYWKSLDFLKTSLSKNTVMVLSTDNPILKNLFIDPSKIIKPGEGRAGGAQAAPAAPVNRPSPAGN
jgi:modulator of FtsH protease HflC